MKIKTRDMKVADFLDGKATKLYFSKVTNIGSKNAVVSILKWTDVTEKVEVHYNFKDEVIVDNNYTWVQIAPFDEHFWIKAMFDEKNDLVEIYIDVTKQNYFDDITNPTYDDLFLDIVIPSKGHIYQMDDVELMKAFNEGVVTEDEYKLAKVVCKKLISYIDEHHKEFLDLINRLKKELEYELYNN